MSIVAAIHRVEKLAIESRYYLSLLHQAISQQNTNVATTTTDKHIDCLMMTRPNICYKAEAV